MTCSNPTVVPWSRQRRRLVQWVTAGVVLPTWAATVQAQMALERRATPAATQRHRRSFLFGYADRVARAPLGSEPGTRFRYDGVNTEVLARVIEAQPLAPAAAEPALAA